MTEGDQKSTPSVKTYNKKSVRVSDFGEGNSGGSLSEDDEDASLIINSIQKNISNLKAITRGPGQGRGFP